MPYGSTKPSGAIGQRPVAVVAQPAVHVAEAVLVRHELDVPVAAERVELPDLLGVERARRGVDLRMVAVGEGVLRVQLHLVDLQRRQPVDRSARRVAMVGTLSRETSSMTPRTGEVGMVPNRRRRAARRRGAAPVGRGSPRRRRGLRRRLPPARRPTGRCAARSPGRAATGRSGAAAAGRAPPRRSARASGAPAAGSRQLLAVDEEHVAHPAADRGVGHDRSHPDDGDPLGAPSAQLVQGPEEDALAPRPGPSGPGAPPRGRGGRAGSPRTRRTRPAGPRRRPRGR